MADTKITGLLSPQVTTNPATDVLPIVNIADTLMASSGSTRKITVNQILGSGGTATLASATITGDLTVDTSTLKVDSTNNRVGINTASPSTALDVFGGNIRLVGGNIFQLLNSVNDSNVDISNNGGTGVASMLFKVAGSSAMTLNSTGLSVGGSPVTSHLISAQGPIAIGGTAGGTRTSYISNSAAASIYYTDGGASYPFDNFGNLIIQPRTSAGRSVIIATSSAAGTPVERLIVDPTGNVGVGVTPSAGKGCLQLSSGITFPATQVASSDANTLDDYEEGTFTPTIVGTTTAGTGTYNTQRGDYIKIGRLVTAQFYIAWTAHTGTGNMNVSGLPFTTQNIGTYLAAASIGFVDLISMTAGNIMTGYAGPNSTTMFLKQTPTGGGASTDIPIDTSGSIIVTLTYIANA